MASPSADPAGEGFEFGLGDEAVDDVEEGGEVVAAEFGDGGEAVAEGVFEWRGRRGMPLGPRSEAGFLRLITTGQLSVADLTLDDYQRCIDLIETYTDLGLGLVDASVVTIAENLGVDTLATLNDRDFRVVRPRHVDAFTLFP